MSIEGKLRKLEAQRVAFWCPGCQELHVIRVHGGQSGPGWTFNGHHDAPTLYPSVLVTSGHYVTGHKGDCWCTHEARTGEPAPFSCTRCHLFLVDGQLRFLPDCTHDLAGQTVPLESPPA